MVFDRPERREAAIAPRYQRTGWVWTLQHHKYGRHGAITFTTVRLDANDLFARKSDPKFQGTVISRLGSSCPQNWRSNWSERSQITLSRPLTSQRGQRILLEHNTTCSLVTGSDSRFPPPDSYSGAQRVPSRSWLELKVA